MPRLLQSKKFWFVCCGLLIVAFCYRSGVSLSSFHPENIRQFVGRFGPWSAFIYLGLYGQPFVPLPATFMAIAAGLIFGETGGTLAALAGATTRAATQFACARWLGRDAVRRLLGERMLRFSDRINSHGFKAVLLVRLIPNVPFDMQNIAFGLTGLAFRPYLLATAIGMLPLSAGYAFLGDTLTQPEHFWKLCTAIAVILILALFPRSRLFKGTPQLRAKA